MVRFVPIFRLTVEVKGHVYREINGQKYEFPVFTGNLTHAHSVDQAISPPLKGPGDEAITFYGCSACRYATNLPQDAYVGKLFVNGLHSVV